MNKKLKGALTIEASLVMPLVIVILVGLLYFAKVYYIQDQVHSAMTKVAHDMSVSAYVVDQIGMVDLQQDLYLEGSENLTNVEGQIEHLQVQVGNIKREMSGVTDLTTDISDLFLEIKEVDATNIRSILDSGVEIVESAPIVVESMSSHMTDLITGIETLMIDSSQNLKAIGLMEIVDLSNGLLATKMVESKMSTYIKGDQISAWGIQDGVIDFNDSNFLLVDDAIQIVAKYKIKLPFGNEVFGAGFPVYQSVTARAWTGSYDAGESKHRINTNLSTEKEDTAYFIATHSEDNNSYHLFSCLRKEMKTATYHEAVVLSNRSVCKYCDDHFDQPDEDAVVYFTSATSKIHYSDECPRVKAIQIIQVTEEEALAMGKTPCKKFGCVEHMKEGKISEEAYD